MTVGKEEGLSGLETLERVHLDLEEDGLTASAQPSIPLPTQELNDILACDGDVIAEEFIKNQAWASYANSLLAHTQASLIQVQNQVVFYQYNAATDYRVEAAQWSSEELKARLWADAQYLDLIRRQQTLAQQKLLLESELSRLKGNISVISRLVTVRGQELQLLRKPPTKRRKAAR